MEVVHIGIDGNLLSWVTDYLDDRKQKVVLDGFSSGWQIIDAGVPQGSVLAPFNALEISQNINLMSLPISRLLILVL
jgi:hypothetical protein